MSLSGSEDSRCRSWATMRFATWSSTAVPRKTMRSLSRREKMSYSRSPRADRSTTVGTRGMPRNLSIQRRHPAAVVALAGGLRQLGVDPREVLARQLDVARRPVLLEVGDALRAWDRHDVVALRQDPGERELPGGDALLLGELADLRREALVALEVVTGEARVVAAEVTLVELVGVREPSGEESAPDRRVGDQADPEVAQRRQDLGLHVARPQR